MAVVGVLRRTLLWLALFWFFAEAVQAVIGVPEVARALLGLSAPFALTLPIVKSVEKALYSKR